MGQCEKLSTKIEPLMAIDLRHKIAGETQKGIVFAGNPFLDRRHIKHGLRRGIGSLQGL